VPVTKRYEFSTWTNTSTPKRCILDRSSFTSDHASLHRQPTETIRAGKNKSRALAEASKLVQSSSFQWCGLRCRQGGGTAADNGKLSLTANQLQNSLHQLTTLTKQGSASRCSREPRNMTIFSCRHVDPPASHCRRKVKTRRKMLPTESRAAAEEEKP